MTTKRRRPGRRSSARPSAALRLIVLGIAKSCRALADELDRATRGRRGATSRRSA
jgi:hypothetical protein